MAAPSTPLDRRAASLDPGFSKTSTTAATVGSITPPDVPSPVPFVRQNAFVLEDSQESEVPTEMYPSHTQATPKVAVGTPCTFGDGDGDDPEHNDDEEASESSDPSEDPQVVFLGDDSDSDIDLPPKERLEQRTGWLHQEWRQLKSHNASFRVGCASWPTYLRDGLVHHGYSLVNGTWIKTGPPSLHNQQRRETEAARKQQPETRASTTGRASRALPAKKPKAKANTVKRVMKSMKALSMKSKKASGTARANKGAGGKVAGKNPSSSSNSPRTPMKKLSKGLGRKGSPKSPLKTPPGKLAMKRTPKTPMKAPKKSLAFKVSPSVSPSEKKVRAKTV